MENRRRHGPQGGRAVGGDQCLPPLRNRGWTQVHYQLLLTKSACGKISHDPGTLQTPEADQIQAIQAETDRAWAELEGRAVKGKG